LIVNFLQLQVDEFAPDDPVLPGLAEALVAAGFALGIETFQRSGILRQSPARPVGARLTWDTTRTGRLLTFGSGPIG